MTLPICACLPMVLHCVVYSVDESGIKYSNIYSDTVRISAGMDVQLSEYRICWVGTGIETYNLYT